MSRPAAPRHHEAPEVATGVPDVADGEEADDEEDEDDEEDDEAAGERSGPPDGVSVVPTSWPVCSSQGMGSGPRIWLRAWSRAPQLPSTP